MVLPKRKSRLKVLMESGIDSLGAVELRNELQRVIGEGGALASTLIFDHPTARQVILHQNIKD